MFAKSSGCPQVSRIVLDICKILLFLVWINHVGMPSSLAITFLVAMVPSHSCKRSFWLPLSFRCWHAAGRTGCLMNWTYLWFLTGSNTSEHNMFYVVISHLQLLHLQAFLTMVQKVSPSLTQVRLWVMNPNLWLWKLSACVTQGKAMELPLLSHLFWMRYSLTALQPGMGLQILSPQPTTVGCEHHNLKTSRQPGKNGEQIHWTCASFGSEKNIWFRLIRFGLNDPATPNIFWRVTFYKFNYVSTRNNVYNLNLQGMELFVCHLLSLELNPICPELKESTNGANFMHGQRMRDCRRWGKLHRCFSSECAGGWVRAKYSWSMSGDDVWDMSDIDIAFLYISVFLCGDTYFWQHLL